MPTIAKEIIPSATTISTNENARDFILNKVGTAELLTSPKSL